jgi:hypothetical protein
MPLSEEEEELERAAEKLARVGSSSRCSLHERMSAPDNTRRTVANEKPCGFNGVRALRIFALLQPAAIAFLPIQFL